MRHATRSRSKASVRGAALIEALVGILIFSIGILGLVGLQASMTRAQGAAKYRADAAYLSSEVIGAMWADKPNVVLGSYATAPGTRCTYQRCLDWVNKVSAELPQGQVVLTTVPTGAVSLTMTWISTSEGTRTYALSTSIQ
jgi:type IV pilus assembly protein PilV